MPAALLPLGPITRPHGLKGEVYVLCQLDDPSLGTLTTVYLSFADGRVVPYEVRALHRPKPTTRAVSKPDASFYLRLSLVGVDTRSAAEALVGALVQIPKAALAQTQEEDEFLASDLIGLKVVGQDGSLLGTVTAVNNYGTADILTVKRPHPLKERSEEVPPLPKERGLGGEGELLIPMVDDFILSIDLARGEIRVHPDAYLE